MHHLDCICGPKRGGRSIRKVRQSVSRLGKAGYSSELQPLANLDHSARQEIELVLEKGRLGAPERVFLRTPAEPKPVLIDFHNFFALELLGHLASAVDTVGLSEMAPRPDQLWLADTRGHYCSELRMLVARS